MKLLERIFGSKEEPTLEPVTIEEIYECEEDLAPLDMLDIIDL